MFIELTEVISSGITAGQRRTISINVEKIATFYPQEHGKGTNIELRRSSIRVEEAYDTIKKLIYETKNSI